MNSNLNHTIVQLIEKYKLNSLEVVGNPRELIIRLLADIKSCSINDIKLGLTLVDSNDLKKLEIFLDEIANKKVPPQYLTKTEYIFGKKFLLDENVLIPRQDTETLIEVAIEYINNNNYKTALDLCTGSGIIGISIANYTNIGKVTLADISEKALNIACENIKLNNVVNKCSTIQSNMFENIYKLNTTYDIILSNPPYLTKNEMKNISDYVKKEPEIALYGGENGLDYYKIIFENARNLLNENGMVMVEIGCGQAKDIVDIISKYACYIDTKIIKDINNKDRVVMCRFQNR